MIKVNSKLCKIFILLLLVFILSYVLVRLTSSQANLIIRPDSILSNSPEKFSPTIAKIKASIPDYYRPMASTFLTFPEWYIVYSSQEYAAFLKTHSPSDFPYFASIAQYWWSYHAVSKLVDNRYEDEANDKFMLTVIGTSFTLEYVAKGLYENTVGRLTEYACNKQQTEEDIYAQKIAEEYAYFIPDYPWFDFHFMQSFKGLWTQTSLVGPHMIRKVERKLFLSLEYLFKASYAAIIRVGSNTTYGSAAPGIYVLASNVPNNIVVANKVVKIIKKINKDQFILELPTEQPFTYTSIKLSTSRIQFDDIAGNTQVMISVVTPMNVALKPNDGQLLFTMNILTIHGQQRMVLLVPTKQLLTTLYDFERSHWQVEHVYAFH